METLSPEQEARIAELAKLVQDFDVPPPQPAASGQVLTSQEGVFTPPEYREPGKREHRRYLVGWRVAIVDNSGKRHQTYYGRVHDVSLGGANIWSEYNLRFSDSVILLLAMPARIPGKRPQIVEVSGSSLYSVLMANRPTFRIGFKFDDFKSGDQRQLVQYLQQVPRVTLTSE